jgi:hypothetical protein
VGFSLPSEVCGLLSECFSQGFKVVLVGAAVRFIKLKKHDTAGAQVVGFRLRINHPSIDLNQIIAEAERDAQ